MNIFVTGGIGFIGKFLTESLLENGHNVTIYDSLVNSSEDCAKKLQDLGANFICGNITDAKHLTNSLANFDICIHLAAQTDVLDSIKDPLYNNLVNISGTRNVLNACVKNDVNVIAASSASIYGESTKSLSETSPIRPQSPYGESKLAMEQILGDFSKSHDINCLNLRFFNVYGIGQNIKYAGVITKFLENIKSETNLTIFGDGNSVRDFVSVYDVVDAIILSIQKIEGMKGEVINIASGVGTKIIELAEMMISVSGKKSISIEYEPRNPGEIIHSHADISLATNMLSYLPKISLKEGLKQLINQKYFIINFLFFLFCFQVYWKTYNE